MYLALPKWCQVRRVGEQCTGVQCAYPLNQIQEFTMTNSDGWESSQLWQAHFSRVRPPTRRHRNKTVSFEVFCAGFACTCKRMAALHTFAYIGTRAPAIQPCNARLAHTQSTPCTHFTLNIEHVIMFANTFKLCTYINDARSTQRARARAHIRHARHVAPPHRRRVKSARGKFNSTFYLSFISLRVFRERAPPNARSRDKETISHRILYMRIARSALCR